MPGLAVVLTLAAMSSACNRSPCEDWADLEVEVIGVEDSSQARQSFEEGLGDFISWTGRSETCVSRVELRSSLDGAVGRYLPLERIVQVQIDVDPQVTVHEFCHALDHEEGWVSETETELLLDYGFGISPFEDNWTDPQRAHEVFAEICDDGPALPALLEALYEVCGIDDSLEVVRFVAGVAFHGESVSDTSLDEYAASSRFTITSTTSTILGSDRGGVAVGLVQAVGSAGLFVLDHAGVVDDLGVATIEPRLLLVDPESATVVDSLALDPHAIGEIGGSPSHIAHSVFGSTSAPILYQFLGDDRGTAWTIQTDPLRLEVLGEFPFEEDAIPVGFEQDGLALVRPSANGPVVVVDLHDGTAIEIGTDDREGIETDQAMAFYADEHGAVVGFPSPAGVTLAGIDWSGDIAWTRDVVIGTDRLRSLFRTPDEMVATTPVLSGSNVQGGSGSAVLSLLYDPTTASWSIPEEGCVGLEGEGWMLFGGENWRVSQPATGDDGYELQLVHLEIDDARR